MDQPQMVALAIKKMTSDTLLIMCGEVRISEASVSGQRPAVADCSERITLCCRALLGSKACILLKDTLLNDRKVTFAQFLKTLRDKETTDASADDEDDTGILATAQLDDLIHFRQLYSMAVQGGDADFDGGDDLERATGYAGANDLLSSELNHVYQLSGFADNVYAEAFVTVHDYDIVLEILVINRTPNTLVNFTVELATMGDMKIVERPQSQNIGLLDQITVRASIKVSSTESGHNFGTIVYKDTAT